MPIKCNNTEMLLDFITKRTHAMISRPTAMQKNVEKLIEFKRLSCRVYLKGRSATVAATSIIKSVFFAIFLSQIFIGCGGDCLNPAICDESKDNPTTQTTTTSSSTSQTLFLKSGTGDAVFDIPKSVSKINIKASYDGTSSNFMAKIGGDSIVNELLGTSYKISQFEGTYLLKDGRTTEIVNSSGVSWTFTEVK